MVETQEFAMRSRATRTSSDGSGTRRESPSYKDTVFFDRKLKTGDTLNKLSIQYQVNVADIKRANNLVSDQDFSALTTIKIPITRMRAALGINSSSEDDDHIIEIDEKTHLIDDSTRSRDPSVEEIFHKTDQSIAQARMTLPEGNGIPGSFHFIDARPPTSSTTCSIWALIAGVVLIFCIIPLVLTIVEVVLPSNNTTIEHHHHHSQK